MENIEEYFESHNLIWERIGKNEGVGNNDFEFDFICVDKHGYLGVFMSFNRGYIPSISINSIESYTKLIYHIDHLPILDVEYENPKNRVVKQFAAQGFFVFDNGSVNRGMHESDYIKCAIPKNPLSMRESFAVKYDSIIPKLNLMFDAMDLIVNLEDYVV